MTRANTCSAAETTSPSRSLPTGRFKVPSGRKQTKPVTSLTGDKVPTITIDAERDPFTAPGNGASYRDRFTGEYDHRTLAGIGHNVPQEAPTAFAQAAVDVDHFGGRSGAGRHRY